MWRHAAAVPSPEQAPDVNAAEAGRHDAAALGPSHQTIVETADAPASRRRQRQAANRYGVTPLYLACVNGNAAVIERLLAAGADPNTALPEGETALMTAAATAASPPCGAARPRRRSVNAKEGWKGQTALMWAAAENNAGGGQGADRRRRRTSAQSKSEAFTPFLFAVRGGQHRRGAGPARRRSEYQRACPNGTSPLVLALVNAHYEMAGVLVDRGADPMPTARAGRRCIRVVWSRSPTPESTFLAPCRPAVSTAWISSGSCCSTAPT